MTFLKFRRKLEPETKKLEPVKTRDFSGWLSPRPSLFGHHARPGRSTDSRVLAALLIMMSAILRGAVLGHGRQGRDCQSMVQGLYIRIFRQEWRLYLHLSIEDMSFDLQVDKFCQLQIYPSCSKSPHWNVCCPWLRVSYLASRSCPHPALFAIQSQNMYDKMSGAVKAFFSAQVFPWKSLGPVGIHQTAPGQILCMPHPFQDWGG